MNYHADTTNYNYAPLFRHRISLKADKISIPLTHVCPLAVLEQREVEITGNCVPALCITCCVFENLDGRILLIYRVVCNLLHLHLQIF